MEAGIINACPNVLQGVSAHMFITLINTLMASQCSLGSEGKYPTDYGPQLKDGDEFDFIIVGAGSAGTVLANRLSEVPEWKVLLLEAGGYPSGMSEIPSLLFSLQNTEEDWQYEMEPSKTYCVSQKNSRCRCPRGKGLGGSSLINAMLYVRSTRYDHDRMVANGNEGWDYDSVRKYYSKFENIHGEDINNETGGELHLTRYTNAEPIRKILQEAYESLGYQYYTDDRPIGFMDLLTSIYQATRQNTAKAFLSPIKERKNLYLATGAHVNKLVADIDDQLTVRGVELNINNQPITVRAKKEVVLSAGSINTPQILMNSGIGPRDHLAQLGIKVLKDLRVGDNFQDHVSLPTLAVGLDQSAFASQSPNDVLNELYNFFIHREGELAKVGLTNFINFVNTENKTDFSNMQIMPVLIKQQEPYLLHEVIRCLGIPDDVAKNIIAYNQNSPLIIFVLVLLHPKSRGSVRLQDSKPFSKPLIFPNFLSDEDDNDTRALLDGIKILQKLIGTDALAPYHPKFIDPSTETCNQKEPNSDAYWKCVIINNLSTLFHPVGTCKMGPASDPTAVVDTRLNVHGVRGVRVVDGSVIPEITSGNTNAPIIMIGEKAADLIKEDWLRREHDEL